MFKVLFLSLILISTQGIAMNDIRYFEDDLPKPKPKPKPDVPE